MNIQISFERGDKRYFMPRTFCAMGGCLYFLLTLEFRLFFKYFLVSITSVVVATFVFSLMGAFTEAVPIMAFCIPNLYVPWIMHRFEQLDDLYGAWKIDYIYPAYLTFCGVLIWVVYIIMAIQTFIVS